MELFIIVAVLPGALLTVELGGRALFADRNLLVEIDHIRTGGAD